MRSLTSTLVAAQQGRAARPCVRVTIDDRHVGVGRLRPEVLYSGGEAGGPAALAVVDGFLLRVHVDGGGNLRLCRTAVSAGSGWDSWVTLATGASNQVQVALAEGNGLYVFWVSAGGAQVLCRRSTDAGTTWGATETVRQAAAGSRLTALAAVGSPAHDCICLFVEDGQGATADDVIYAAWRVGTWTAQAWPRDPGDGGLGLAAVAGPGSAAYAGAYLAACGRFEDTSRPAVRLYHLQLSAGGDASWLYRGPLLVSDDPAFAWGWPALVAAEPDRPRLFVVEQTAHGSRTGQVTISQLETRGAVAAGDLTPLGQEAAKGVGVGAADGQLYLGCAAWVWRAPVYQGLAGQRLDASADVVAYEGGQAFRGTSASGCELQLLLDNSARKYDAATAPPLRPGSQVCLAEGYRTPAGDEVVLQAPYWVEEIERAEQVEPLPGGQVTLRCYDGWGKLWRSQNDRAREWWCAPSDLLAEVVERLGFCYSDDSSPSLYCALVPPRFTLAMGQPWGGLVAKVLDYCGCELRFLVNADEEATWPSARAHIFTPESPSAYAYSPTAHPVREVALSEREAPGAWVQVHGDGVFGEAVDGTAVATLGYPAVRQAIDMRLNEDTDITAAAAAGYLLGRYGRQRLGGRLAARPNVAIELLDVVTVQVGSVVEARRVVGIERRYDRLRGIYEQRLRLAGV